VTTFEVGSKFFFSNKFEGVVLVSLTRYFLGFVSSDFEFFLFMVRIKLIVVILKFEAVLDVEALIFVVDIFGVDWVISNALVINSVGLFVVV